MPVLINLTESFWAKEENEEKIRDKMKRDLNGIDQDLFNRGIDAPVNQAASHRIENFVFAMFHTGFAFVMDEQ
jgi:hypothetical protein